MSIKADYHIHSSHSGDSTSAMVSMIESAISNELTDICFTEHMDMDYPVYLPDVPKDCFTLDTDSYHNELLSLQSLYKDRITIRFGVELGMQPHLVSENSDYVQKHPFDFVIGSNHLCHHEDPYYPAFFEGRSSVSSIRDFLECTLENIRSFDDFDVLGHLDYIVRYVPQKNAYHWEDYRSIIEEILQLLIKNDKGLDVNTKSLQDPGYAEPNPCAGILQRYHALGGRIITFGSDAHRPDHIAYGFDRLPEIVKECGFTSYCTFQNRTPVFHDL